MNGRRVMIVSAAILGSAIVMLGESVMNLALPQIGRTFNVPFSYLQWVIDGYNLSLSSLILFGGSLGDGIGLRKTYLYSIAAFTVLSLLCAFAWSALSLIILRIFLGIAGALLTPVSLALVNAQLPRELRSRGIGYWTAWTTGVLTVGPLIGGYLIDVFSWRSIFLINIPLCILAFILAVVSLERSEKIKTFTIDWFGALVATLSLTALTFGLIEGPQLGWSVLTVGSIILGCTLFCFFVWWEGRTKGSLINLSLFKNVTFAATNFATFLLYAGFSGFGFSFAIFLQTIAGYSSTLTGAAFIPSSVLLMLFSGRVGAISAHLGPRLFMTLGPLLCGLGMLLLLPIGPHISYLTGILPGVVLFGIGLTLVVAPLTATALNAAPDEKSGIASAINNGLASVGPLIVIATFGLFSSAGVYTVSVFICAFLCFAAAAISFLFVRQRA